ncbi:MAG: hypothetical protein HC769_06705 [Cyanobacteria bacterium CRU_2_1]|nr:hypothetical protein [Cyanobacteria bacterium RU_5_0]NJR58570.1 hypothetical protein [Cyanobacteria bacterium CRU_2_1]
MPASFIPDTDQPLHVESDQSFNLMLLLDVITDSEATSQSQLADPAELKDRESVKILVIGSRKGINRIVYRLHELRFAEFPEWSRLLPAPVPGKLMRILIRKVAID